MPILSCHRCALSQCDGMRHGHTEFVVLSTDKMVARRRGFRCRGAFLCGAQLRSERNDMMLSDYAYTPSAAAVMTAAAAAA